MSTHHPTMNPRAFPGPMAAAPRPMGYHGAGYHHHYPHYHGFCHVCCHPMSMCICGFRECRKEAKELLVRPGDKLEPEKLPREMRAVLGELNIGRAFMRAAADIRTEEVRVAEESGEGIETPTPASEERAKLLLVEARQAQGAGLAFIGGGCCVHLSIEYTASNEQSAVLVGVLDSENTVLAWAKFGMRQGYYIKESIITTNPGATLVVGVIGVTARVRWCEVFSC